MIENAPIGTHITTVNASDADTGSNGLVTYYFSQFKGMGWLIYLILTVCPAKYLFLEILDYRER